jgi:hypothetical protein
MVSTEVKWRVYVGLSRDLRSFKHEVETMSDIFFVQALKKVVWKR